MKFIKTLTFSIIAVLLLNVLVFAARNEGLILVEGGTAAPGETVEVTVSLENNPGVAYLRLDFSYDKEVLTLVDVKDAGKLGTAVHDTANLTRFPYILNWANDLATQNFTYNGTLVTLTFQINPDAPFGETPVSISYGYDNYDSIDVNFNKVYFEVENGVVRVGDSATTDLSEFEYEIIGKDEIMIVAYNGSDAKVKIGSSYMIEGKEYFVTVIGEEAFVENETLESVEIPATVVEIEPYAFADCFALTELKLSEGLEIIGEGAFSACESLTEVAIPATVTSIDAEAFLDCESLMLVTIYGTETKFGECCLGYTYSRRKYYFIEGLVIEGYAGSTAQDYAENAEDDNGDVGIEFRALIGFYGVSLTLQNNLCMNYKVEKVLLADATDYYVEFESNGQKTTAQLYKEDATYYTFRYDDVAPQCIAAEVKATLYAEFDGELRQSAPMSYSIQKYCEKALEIYADDGYAAFRTLIVDLLNYATKAQNYTKYEIDSPANGFLTAQQKAWGTQGDPVLENHFNPVLETVANPSATWYGAGLVLDTAVTLKLKFAAESVEGLTVRIETENGKTLNISSGYFEYKSSDGLYYLYVNGLHACQMGMKLKLTVLDANGNAVSNTAQYSIESYAYDKQNSTIEGLADLVKAMMNYGNAAQAYAATL